MASEAASRGSTGPMEGAEDGATTARVLHWYDFVCPFCYLAQSDNRKLVEVGVDLIELTFHAHPEIPRGGLPFAAEGPRFAMISRLAAERGVPLHWSDRLPYTVPALAAAEWARVFQPDRAADFRRAVFTANFVDREDIGDPLLILSLAERVDIPVDSLRRVLNDGSGEAAVQRSTALGRRYGVRGTPAWWSGGRLLEGLQQGGIAASVDRPAFAAEVRRT